MTRLILSTVGTSLRFNAQRAGVPLDDSAAVQSYLRTDPQRASAEANALLRLIETGDELVFLASDTPDGLACAASLQTYFAGLGNAASLERVAGLTNQHSGFARHGLRNFVRLLAGHIRDGRRRGLDVGINNTGGFKIQIAYGNVVGLIFGVPVYYIHENFTDLLTLPVSPVGWDYSLFAWYGEFFDWLDSAPRLTTEVQGRLASLPEQVALLLEDADDGHTYLSALGETYLEAFRGKETGRRPLMLSAQAKRSYDTLNFTPQGEFRQLLERLRHGDAGDWQRSSEAVREGIYKFPKGHSPHRVFVREDAGKLWVLELSGHTEERRYQQLIQGIREQDYDPAGFTELH